MIPREQAAAAAGWRAHLKLRYARQGPRTVLAARQHSGPLAVQKPLYPEGHAVCHSIILHPPAGMAGGDQVEIAAAAEPGSHALLTTPGAGKWYRSAGPEAGQRLDFHLDQSSVLEWLPQETIVFDGARAALHTEVRLAPGACYLGWDILCLGRTACGERFNSGSLTLRTRLWSGDKLLWLERGRIEGGGSVLASAAGLGGHPVCATLLAAGQDIGADLLAECRAAQQGDRNFGITALPRLLIARYLGGSAETARRRFTRLWEVLRPALLGRAATAPRIWNT